MASPAIAAIVVAYESAASLPATLGALREQLGPDDELIVVDNASRDKSAELAHAAGARVILSPRNVGFAAGCRLGVSATQAPLLFFCNPDAVLATGALAALRATASEHPGWGAWQALVTLTGGHEVNTSGGVTHWLGMGWAGAHGTSIEAVGHEPREVSFASGAALVVRRAAWTEIDGFEDAYFMYCEDLDLSLRLHLAGWGVGVVPAARVEHDYEFAKGDYKWFHLERNRWWTVLGAYPAPLLALALPALFGFEVALLFIAARDGWLRAKLRAQMAVVRTLPWALRRRARVQTARRVSTSAFAAALSSSLESPYLGASSQAAPVFALQSGYWAGVVGILRVADG